MYAGTDIYSCAAPVYSRGCYLLLVNVVRYTTRQTMIRECLQCETFRGDVRFVTPVPLVSSRLPSRFFATLSMAVRPPVSFAILRLRNTTIVTWQFANKRSTVCDYVRHFRSIDTTFFLFFLFFSFF